MGPATRRQFAALLAGLPLALQQGAPDGRFTAGPPPRPARRAAVLPGHFRAHLPAVPRSIDPARVSTAEEMALVTALFTGLFRYDPDLRLVPALAQAVPTIANGGVSADGLTYTVRLRGGLTWSDGQPLTAFDFEYSLKRLLTPTIEAPNAGQYFAVAGAQAFHEAAVPESAVGIRAIDGRTLVIELERPQPAFPHLLALAPASPVRRDLIERFGDRWTEAGRLIGNGPFRLIEWALGRRLTMAPNRRYAGDAPRLNALTWQTARDGEAAFQGYLNDELDLVAVPPRLSARLELIGELGQPIHAVELATDALALNTRLPPFDNLQVRQAIATAIDRATFTADRSARPALSWLPPGLPGHDPAAGTQYRFDPARARQLLAAAGFPDGRGLPPIRFSFADGVEDFQRVAWFRTQFRRHLGIELLFDGRPRPNFEAALAGHALQLWWSSWQAEYPDPANWLPAQFGATGAANQAQLADPELDRLFASALAAPDEFARLARWQQAQRRILELAPIAPVSHPERRWLLSPGVRGLQTTPFDQLPGSRFYERVEVD